MKARLAFNDAVYSERGELSEAERVYMNVCVSAVKKKIAEADLLENCGTEPWFSPGKNAQLRELRVFLDDQDALVVRGRDTRQPSSGLFSSCM